MDYIVKKLVAKQLKAKGKARQPKKGGAQEPNPIVGFGKKKKRGAAMKRIIPKTRGGVVNRPISFGNTIEGLSF